ncbi:MAG: CoA-binding protein [Verrucomicrobiota bacterium]
MNLENYQNPDVIRRTLDLKTVALVGLSSNDLRASNFVGRYLLRHGYVVYPVNPRETSILGQPCFPSIGEIGQPVDIVDVFRRPDAVPDIAREAVDAGARCLWLQYGVISETGAGIAEAGGLDVVMDRCLKVEHARYLGRMHWLGMNTGRISAVRCPVE